MELQIGSFEVGRGATSLSSFTKKGISTQTHLTQERKTVYMEDLDLQDQDVFTYTTLHA
jgi:hypothetical protein